LLYLLVGHPSYSPARDQKIPVFVTCTH
jgi:hypothetical protein